MGVATLPEPISFTLAPGEAKRAIEASSGEGPAWWISALNLVNLIALSTNTMRLANGLAGGLFLALVVLTASFIGLALFVAFFRFRPRLPKGVTTLTFADAGVQLDDGRARRRTIPWREVARVERTGDAIVLAFRPAFRVLRGLDLLIVPKRALSDGGDALWTSLDERLTGKRYLSVTHAPRTLLVNNTAR